MKHLTQFLLAFFWKFGGPGLLVLGILDSSFVFAPLGNDLLVVALTAREHSVAKMIYYASMSTIGSVVGCLLVDLLFRRAGYEVVAMDTKPIPMSRGRIPAATKLAMMALSVAERLVRAEYELLVLARNPGLAATARS